MINLKDVKLQLNCLQLVSYISLVLQSWCKLDIKLPLVDIQRIFEIYDTLILFLFPNIDLYSQRKIW